MYIISLGILVLIFGASLFWRRSFGIRVIANNANFWQITRIKLLVDIFYKYIFLFSIILIFILLFYQSYQQYQVWSQNELSKFLIPPYQNISYFIFYVGVRFFAPYLISLVVALIFIFSAKALNKKYDDRFFEPEELYFGAISLFLVGHPGWLFYSVFIIIFYLLIHLYSLFIIHNSSNRISLYYVWLPTAIFVILISSWLQKFSLWSLLKL
ncbi:MAG: hypothetical protein AAB696_01170 [Patescibacteria group bacterium]